MVISVIKCLLSNTVELKEKILKIKSQHTHKQHKIFSVFMSVSASHTSVGSYLFITVVVFICFDFLLLFLFLLILLLLLVLFRQDVVQPGQVML